jgi:hypothetical protein
MLAHEFGNAGKQAAAIGPGKINQHGHLPPARNGRAASGFCTFRHEKLE